MVSPSQAQGYKVRKTAPTDEDLSAHRQENQEATNGLLILRAVPAYIVCFPHLLRV
jgi:hypothetical protein